MSVREKKTKKRVYKKGFQPTNPTHIRAQMRARKVLTLINENPSKGIGAAMIEVGYAPLTAAQPHNLTKSKVWLDLLDEYLPRNEVLEAHRGLLKASQVQTVTFESPSETFTDEYIAKLFSERACTVIRTVRRTQTYAPYKDEVLVYFWAADQRARKDGLEMAYKLRGDYAPEKHMHAHFSLLDLGKQKDATLIPAAPDIPRIEDVEA